MLSNSSFKTGKRGGGRTAAVSTSYAGRKPTERQGRPRSHLVAPRAALGFLPKRFTEKFSNSSNAKKRAAKLPKVDKGPRSATKPAVQPGDDFDADYGIPTGGKPKNRRAGIVLHPTSLPGPYGAGDLGPNAYHFIDWLQKAGMQAWQVLPLVPPERMFWSPYAGQNANSGNVLLISLEGLLEDQLLKQSELPYSMPQGNAEFETVAQAKEPLLSLAATRFVALDDKDALKSQFQTFCAKNEDWLDSAALFHCLSNSEELLGLNWWDWPEDLRDMEDMAMGESAQLYKEEIMEFKALQFLFDKQWMSVRRYANSKGVSIIGDMPIYVGGHSADVWANRDLFELNEEGKAMFVSGCPPDAFSKTGQLWGNPLYDWKAQKKDGYSWWIRRLRRAVSSSKAAHHDAALTTALQVHRSRIGGPAQQP